MGLDPVIKEIINEDIKQLGIGISIDDLMAGTQVNLPEKVIKQLSSILWEYRISLQHEKKGKKIFLRAKEC
ncbi:MAG: hypothetical protein Q6363_005740 [Candidatus Njordarchaeota archaeon]